MPKVTTAMAKLELETHFKEIQEMYLENRMLQEMSILPVLGLRVNMILGQRFASIHPEVILTLPSGLTVYHRKLMPAEPGQVACIGGPVEALNSLANNFQTQSVLSQLMYMCNNISNYVPKLDFFPAMNPEIADVDISVTSEVTEEIKAAEARAGHWAVPAVSIWETKKPTLNYDVGEAAVEDMKTEVGTAMQNDEQKTRRNANDEY